MSWEAQKGNMLAPPGHTASKRPWTPVPPTVLTILCYHWPSLGPHYGQLLCLADPRSLGVIALFAWAPAPFPPPPNPAAIRAREGHLDPLPHLHQPEL